MIIFVVRRLLISIPVLIVSSFIVFMLVASSGDPLGDLLLRPGVTKGMVEARRRQLGLDKPPIVRYARWVKGIAKADLGKSLRSNEDVGPILLRALAVTLRLVVFATLIAILLAVVIGVLQGLYQYRKFDYVMTFFAFLFFSMPTFWLAAVLKDIGIRINIAVGTRIFFTVGEQTPNLLGRSWAIWLDRIGHLLLPSLTLVLIQMAAWSRFQRAGMLEVLNADYIRTAYAKGLSRRRVIFRHALRNALIPVVTVTAIDFAAILGGAVITETVFGWAGMGRLLLQALEVQDVNVVQAWLLVAAMLVIVFNLFADVMYAYLDPRIRYG